MDLKRTDGKLVKRRDKNNGWKFFNTNRFDNIEPSHFRHLNIEKNEVWRKRLNGRDCLSTVDALPGNFKIGVGGESLPQTFAGEFHIVDNQCAHSHIFRLSRLSNQLVKRNRNRYNPAFSCAAA